MEKKYLMKGNEAMAEAAIRSGCKCFFGYPITPQTEVAAYMAKRMFDVDGGVYLQAESEVAAANMVYGAAAGGTRVMTSSSSPGISLKSEAISYIAACDLPCLIVNIQRAGPGLGGIQPSQSDYWQATRNGHGDFHLLVFAPNSVQEMVDLTQRAFDKSDMYRVPSMILGDGLLGQMMEPVGFPENMDKNVREKKWATNGHKNKREHNIVNSLYLNPSELEKSNFQRFERYEIIKENEQIAEEYMIDDADIVVTAFGATSRIAKSAVNDARKQGLKVGLIRPISLWPFPTRAFRKCQAKQFLCVEMNMGQMIDDVKLAIDCRCPVEFYGRVGGCVPKQADILNKIIEMLERC